MPRKTLSAGKPRRHEPKEADARQLNSAGSSARTQLANSFMVSLRLGAGLGMQIFVPSVFVEFVWRTPCAKPLQKFSRAKLALLVGVDVQASARSPDVLMLTLGDVGRGGAGC